MAATEDLPRAKAPNTKVKVRAIYEYRDAEGKPADYRLIRPNAIVGAALMSGPSGDMDMSYLNDYLVGHIHPEEREQFKAAIISDDGIDMEVLSDMMEQMNGLVYDDLPSEPS